MPADRVVEALRDAGRVPRRVPGGVGRAGDADPRPGADGRDARVPRRVDGVGRDDLLGQRALRGPAAATPSARELYPSMDLLTSGQLFPVGQAVRGRRRVPRQRPLAVRVRAACTRTGSSAAAWSSSTACRSSGERGLPEMHGRRGSRATRSTIHDTWHTTGLAGSGSNDYSVTDVFVPEGARLRPVRRRTPVRSRCTATAASSSPTSPAVSIGCARRMVDDLQRR